MPNLHKKIVCPAEPRCTLPHIYAGYRPVKASPQKANAQTGSFSALAAGDKEIERLQSVPGVGPTAAFAFAAHAAAERFENPGQAGNYPGLVPRAEDAVRYGKIAKRGNGYLRALSVQAAWALIHAKKGGKLKGRYGYMTIVKSKNKKQAIVAATRRIAELLYTLMRGGTAYEARPFIREMTGDELARLVTSA